MPRTKNKSFHQRKSRATKKWSTEYLVQQVMLVVTEEGEFVPGNEGKSKALFWKFRTVKHIGQG